jgi:CheY-like chemotaxis protein
MGGSIWVKSEVGVGSIFHFLVNLGVQPQAEPYQRPISQAFGALKVLVADDNSVSRQVLVQMLENFGFRADQTPNSHAALASIREADQGHAPYDFVFLDYKMPNIDGVQCHTALVNYTTMPSSRIIMMTAYSQDYTPQGSNLNPACVLTKPITAYNLLCVIRKILGDREVLGSPPWDQGLETALEKLWGVRILLVEDNAINQELTLDLLRNHGLVVVVANNGQEALQCLEHDHFDGVLMDCEMPIMDGYTATQEIRKQPHLQNLPILAMTASVLPEDRERVKLAGMNDYIPKPIQVNLLFQIMAQWITRPSCSIPRPFDAELFNPEPLNSYHYGEETTEELDFNPDCSRQYSGQT